LGPRPKLGPIGLGRLKAQYLKIKIKWATHNPSMWVGLRVACFLWGNGEVVAHVVKSKSCLSYWTSATTVHGWNGGEELAILGGLVKGRRLLVWSLLRTLAGAGWGYSGEGKESTIFITMGTNDDMRKGNHEGEGLLSLVMAGCVVTVRRELKRKLG